MSVSKFFEKMIGLQKQRSQQKQNSYRELVAAIATGKEPNLGEVERLLSEFGMSLDDLKQDVEVYQTRIALKALVATLPKIDQETALVQQKIAAADRDHRLEQANAFQKQAELIRQKINENKRSHEQRVKRREEIEERMRLA